MRGNDVFIAFANKNTALAVAKTVIADNYNVVAVLLNAGDLIRTLSFYNGGIIICGCQFGDKNINSLINIIPPQFKIVAVGTMEQLDYCGSDRIFKLSVPLNRAELISHLEMLVPQATKNGIDRTPKEQAAINKAKRFLITHYNMTETQAHRFLEKKSMDLRVSVVEIAKKIIDC